MPKIKQDKDKQEEKQKEVSPLLLMIRKDGLWNVCYAFFYIIGIWLIRLYRRTIREQRIRFFIGRNHARKNLILLWERIKVWVQGVIRRCVKPMRTIASKVETMERYLQIASHLKGWAKAEAYGKILWAIVRNSFVFFRKLFNYIVPVAALIFCVTVFQHYDSMVYALKVEYNGEDMGYINTESEFFAAEKQMKARIIYEDYVRPTDTVPRFTLEVVDIKDIVSIDELTNKIIATSGNELLESDGLYIDNKFWGATEESEKLLSLLNTMLLESETGDPTEHISFVKSIELKNGLYPVTSVFQFEELEERLTGLEQREKTYITQKNDAPLIIAQKHSMPYEKLKMLNPGIEEKLLIGQEVLISQAVPVMGVKRTVTETYTEEIPYRTEKSTSKNYEIGYNKVTTEGKKGTKEIVANVTYMDGAESERTVLSSKVLKEPINEKVVVGSKVVAPTVTAPSSPSTSGSSGSSGSQFVDTTAGGYMWPVDGGYVSCGIWGYPGHTGMDIAAKQGTPVRASAAGTVVVAKNMVYGYGRYILIDHGNGLQTLYAHNSVLHVSVGQRVEKGQLIASMGRTGNASGPHVHVEFRSSGRYLDPGQYIGYRYNR